MDNQKADESQNMSRRFFVFGIFIIVVGCTPPQQTADIVKTVNASGTLTLNGAPLEFYQVSFFPNENRPAMGITDAAGRFTLGTNKPNDGAVAGSHKIAIVWVGPPSTDPNEGMMEFSSPPPPPIEIDKKYSNPETSGLVLEVPESGSTELNVELK